MRGAMEWEVRESGCWTMQCIPYNRTGTVFLIPFSSTSPVDLAPHRLLIKSAQRILTAHHSGQGGNQSLHDTADFLPKVLALNDIARSLDDKTALTEAQIEQTCRRYEDAMTDRAFPWVRQSGETSFPHLDFDGVLGTVARLVSWTIVPVVRVVYCAFRSGR